MSREPLRTARAEPEAAERPSFLGAARLGHYQLHEVLGEGGMGIVFRATRLQGAESVALKTVNRVTRRRMLALREEIVALRAVKHPGLVRILDQGSQDGIPWYAMELLTGKTLAHYNDLLWDAALEVTRSGVSQTAWSAAQAHGGGIEQRVVPTQATVAGGALEAALRLYRDLCEPLGYIHARGMVHRDLKPQNVFIRTDDQPVLMDFGLIGYASGAIGREVLEAGNQGFGTVHYVSPERIEGRQVDARADLYSLGCMLYETLVGRPPFIGEAGHVLSQHLSATPLPPSQVLSGVPPALEGLILQLLAKAPATRVGHARDVAAALVEILGDDKVPSIDSDAVPLFRPQLSGREEVLSGLSRALDRALDKQGSLLLVGGESGVGKTFLTSELAHAAVKRGFRVVAGGAMQFSPTMDLQVGDTVGPFQALRSLLQTIADSCRERGPEESERVLGRRALYLAPFEPSLEAFVDLEGGAHADTLPGAANLERIKTAMAESLRAYANSGPLLLIVDDLQWADALSTGFLATLDRAFFDGLPLVVLCTYRTEHSPVAADELRRSAACTHFLLEKLGDSAVRCMVTDMLSSEPPSELVTFLVSESQGNPFFIAEYLRFLVAGKQLVRVAGRWLLRSEQSGGATDYRAIRMPGKLEELLSWRLRALSEPARRVIEAGAVLGRSFDLEILSHVVGESEEWLLEVLREARERLVIEALSLNSYRFRHDKLREATYAGLSPGGRSDLHVRAARAMEALTAGERVTSRSRELAFHYELGGDSTSALRHFVLAGEEALAKAAVHEAIDHLRSALRLEAIAGGVAAVEKARWMRMLGGALHDIGDFPEGNRCLEQALVLLGERSSRERRMPLGALIVAEVLRQACVRLWPGAPRRASNPDNALQRAKIHGLIQQAAYYTDDALPMLYSCLRMLNLAERGAPSPSLTVAYANAQAVAGIIPSRRLADLYAALARRNMNAAPNTVARAHFCLIAAGYATGIADWPAAFAAVEEGLEVCVEIDFAQRARELCAATSSAHYLASQYPGARAAAARLRSQATGKDAHTHCWALLLEAQVLMVEGQLEASLDNLQSARSLLRTLGRPERIWAHSLEAFVCAKLGHATEAERASDAAVADIVGAPLMNYFVVDSVARCAEVRLCLARKDPGSKAKKHSALSTLRALSAMKRAFPIAEPRLLLLQAAWARLRGEERSAEHLSAASEAAAKRLSMPYERARALLAQPAKHCAADQAEELLARLGAAKYPAQPL